ncbi:MAG: hypothetical protein KDC42_11615 [Ignavibacteriae bacterium]|nr:hypothetical protein [Ignavibacteriota bacterium]
MDAKRLIFTAVLLIALNFSFQPAQSTLFQRERHSIVHVVDVSDDPYMSGFIDSNKKAIQRISVSLTAIILATDLAYSHYDTS